MHNILIVGLGNPGYSGTRHNLGADFLITYLKTQSHIQKINPNLFQRNNIYYYIEPSMMNISGQYIQKMIRKYNCKYLIVIIDDLNQKIGKYKVSTNNLASGHNGVKSILQYYNKPFIQIRIGIGRPENQDISEFVLSKFNEQ